ncbi:hypothetical protein PIB30_102302 [Stylosanthes scabra]|uniref:Retrotransposon gag domain-containing protein n=1 Tax=Stylosanthes scabra TaxID=79078 RepID=A0ABU6SXY8_9FABA|nr:hypothetical protein [Stylosanthes scabra]
MWIDGINRAEMATRGRGRNTASTRTGSRSNTTEILAAINTMTAAMRDSAAATNRAVDQMYHNRNFNHNNQNIPEEEGEDGNGRPMSLATFLKVKPPEFKGTVNVTEADDWFQAIERSLQAQQGTMTVDEYARKFEDLCRFARVCQGAPETFMEWKCA